ncbi:MAG TPA: hypothetical protein VIH46_02495 [Candidatus Acidoferrales bacterium]|jgi:hypothetical protein
MRRAMYLAPVLALGLALACVAPALHGQDSRAEIQKRLAAEFKRTKLTADRSDIATAGSVLDLHKDGLVMCSTEAIASPTNTYKNGALSFGFGANMAWGMALAPANQQTTAIPQRKFVTGEKFWVTDYIVKLDGVVFQFYSDPYNDVRYYGQLKFPFTKNVAPPADEVMKAIEEVITAEADTQEAAPAENAAPAAQQAAAQPAAAPKTIALGQTTDQVVEILGQPQKIVNLGAKQMYFYADMKVIFTNGKVTDVQ